MSNVIIELDKAKAERLVELLKERGADDNNFMLKQVKPQLEGKCKRSMIEWYPASEMIWKGYDILVRFDNGSVAPMYSDDFAFALERGAIEWAYMPE